LRTQTAIKITVKTLPLLAGEEWMRYFTDLESGGSLPALDEVNLKQ
jgi:hypothetical protein